MRTFLAFVILLCVVAGLYLIQGPEFWWPDRRNPSCAIRLDGLASQLLGLALLITAGLGVTAARQASRADGRAASRRWQWGFFVATLIVLGLLATAAGLGEYGPNPEARTTPPPSAC